MRKEVVYLGHLITEDGVRPNPEKIKAVVEFPVPNSAKDIKSFLGFVGYYRRFIANFSTLSKPLTKLLKRDTPFLWSDDQQQAFEILKSKLIKEPILQYPDMEKEFILTTDASQFSIGGLLSQRNNLGHDLPIAYASRTLNRAEINYSTIERELLAIVWCVRHFRPYLYGRKFKIATDHRPLTWLFNVKDPGLRLVRWRLFLEEYEYEIIYKPGKMNTNADALSRIRINSEEDSDAEIRAIQGERNIETYKTFLETIEKSVILYDKVNEHDDSLFTSKDSYAICISEDLNFD